MVCADFGTSAKEVAASWLTVPEKMMLDFVVSAARSVACGAAAFVQPDSTSHAASHKPAAPKLALRNNVGIFMWASFLAPSRISPGPSCERASRDSSWDHRDAKIEW